MVRRPRRACPTSTRASPPCRAPPIGTTALSLLQQTADSEIADLYVNGAGQVVFRDRHAPLTDPRSTTVQAVFGDNAGTVHPDGTELPYTEITRPDDDMTMATTSRPPSTAARTCSRPRTPRRSPGSCSPAPTSASDLILQTDPDALQWAYYVLAIGRNDESRFDALTIQATADPDNLFPQVLGRELGDRIQVWRDPPGMAAISKDCFIRSVTHTITVDGWVTEWGLQNAERYAFFILDDPTLGQLGVSSLGF